MSKGVFRRVGDTLVPASEEGTAALRAVPEGKTCMAEIRASRSPRQHALFWKLCTMVSEASDQTKENVKRNLLLEMGYADIWLDRKGRMHVEPKSIAWESMEQAEFNSFFQAAIRKIAEWLGSAPADVQRRFDEMVYGGLPARRD